MPDFRAFLSTWIIGLVGIALAVAGLNLLVDPYDVFGIPRISGISKLKPGPRNHVLLAKTYQEARARPTTLLIGSSSTHIGIDAAAPEWPEAMQPVYNYGIPGGYATSTSLNTLRQALIGGTVRNAVVFLDFQNFFVPEQPSAITEDDRRYGTLPNGAPNPDRPLQVARDMFLSLATMGAFVDSVETIAGQTNHGLLNLSPNGSSTESDFIDAAAADGMYDLFAQKASFEESRIQRIRQNMATWKGRLPNLEVVEGIIKLSKAKGVSLTLVLTPHHVAGLELYWRNGLWPRVEQLKSELAELVAAQDASVGLWDFMDYSAYNTESVPLPLDRRTPTKWFWEPTHFKKQLGALMIQRILGNKATEFGARLTPDTLPAWNATVRNQREALICERHDASLRVLLKKEISDGCPFGGAQQG